MGWRFRRSVRLLPGIRLNFSGSGVTTTLGPRGAHVTLGGKRTRVTTGIPGTGISYSTLLSERKRADIRKSGSTSGGGWLAIIALFGTIAFCSRQSPSPVDHASSNVAAPPPSAPAVPLPPAEKSVPYFVAVDALNMRDAPDGRLVGKLSRGDGIPVYETAGDWARISPKAQPPQWVSFTRLCAGSGCFERAIPKKPAPAPATTAATARAAAAPARSSKPIPIYSPSCPCSGANYCVGPRGGVYCITSGGNKRYVPRR
jgi:hypothetical protein